MILSRGPSASNQRSYICSCCFLTVRIDVRNVPFQHLSKLLLRGPVLPFFTCPLIVRNLNVFILPRPLYIQGCVSRLFFARKHMVFDRHLNCRPTSWCCYPAGPLKRFLSEILMCLSDAPLPCYFVRKHMNCVRTLDVCILLASEMENCKFQPFNPATRFATWLWTNIYAISA